MSRAWIAREVAAWSVGGVPKVPSPEDRVVEIAELRETHASLRLLDESSVRAMRESLVRHGQLMALAAYREGAGALAVIDGFKRLRAARELGWVLVRVRILSVDVAEAKAAIGILNHGRGLSELEEAWVVRSLYREDALTQPQIGRLLGRHKSWVCRRLLLAEGLDEVVQANVRLGLVAARTAEAVARLPRVNQRPAAEAVMKRGLTHRQTERLVAEVLARPAAEREAALRDAVTRVPEIAGAATGTRRLPERTPAQWLMADIAALTRIAARLQARLWDRPLDALGVPAAQLVADGLGGLAPALAALGRTINHAIAGDHHVEDARRA
jgi:ParB-like chromosome segregation protein Spo0J